MLKLDHNRCPRGEELAVRVLVWWRQRTIIADKNIMFSGAYILNYPYKNRGILNYSNLYNNRCLKLK